MDLTVLSIDERQLPVSLRLRRMTVCKDPPSPGEEVIVAIPEGIARSHVISPALLPGDLAPKYRTAISDVATTGNSGSGALMRTRNACSVSSAQKYRGLRLGKKIGVCHASS